MQTHGHTPHSIQADVWRWVRDLLGVLILVHEGLEAWEYIARLLFGGE